MKVFKDKLDDYKSKKELVQKLKFYSDIVQKKVDMHDLNSALDKARSALTLIREYQEKFDLEKELNEFEQIIQKVTSDLNVHRNIYVRRLNNLLNEKVDEINLENFMKLLAMLKSEVDKSVDKYNLKDISHTINRYFEFIKRLYAILSSYQVVNYFDVAEQIFRFMKDLERERFKNLENLIQSIYQKLVYRRLFELSKQYDKITLSELREKLAMSQEDVVDFIIAIMEQPEGPIKVFNNSTKEIIFNK